MPGRYSRRVGSETGLRFEALGALRVCADTEIELTRPARRRVLSIMLLESGRSIPVPRLIDRMWGDSAPGDPRNTLQAHMAGLRRQLGDVIELTPDGYRLEVADHWFDVDEFTLLADRVEASVPHRLPEEIAEMAGSARRLWRGDPFPDLIDDDYARGTVEALGEIRLRTETRWLDALLASGRVEEVLPELERLVTEFPDEERFWERLMLARYRIGNTAGALRAFQTFRGLLGDELGVEPGASLRTLEERILLHDPSRGRASPPPAPHNLPPSSTSFVGRDADAEAIVHLLEAHRLVTVTGGPGLGKTRLALEVGHRMTSAMPGGVWLVRLVGATSEHDVTATISAAMGILDRSRTWRTWACWPRSGHGSWCSTTANTCSARCGGVSRCQGAAPHPDDEPSSARSGSRAGVAALPLVAPTGAGSRRVRERFGAVANQPRCHHPAGWR